jgi:hypothetical protein
MREKNTSARAQKFFWRNMPPRLYAAMKQATKWKIGQQNGKNEDRARDVES